MNSKAITGKEPPLLGKDYDSPRIVASRKDSCRRFNPFYCSVILFVNGRQLQENWRNTESVGSSEFTIEVSYWPLF